MNGRWLVTALLAGSLAAGGCDAGLPTYRWTGADDALRIMADRNAAVDCVTALCAVTLKDGDGDVVRLDGELAARRCGLFRTRLYKLGRPMIDVTVNDDGFWIYTAPGITLPEDDAGADQFHQLADIWPLLWGFEAAEVTPDDRGGRRFVLRRTDEATGSTVDCEVERRTLTPRAFHVVDRSGAIVRTLRLDRYRSFGDTVWPTWLVASTERQSFEVELRDVRLNGNVPRDRFHPPRRAWKRP